MKLIRACFWLLAVLLPTSWTIARAEDAPKEGAEMKKPKAKKSREEEGGRRHGRHEEKRFDRYLTMTDSLGRMNSRRFAIWQKAVALAPVLLLLVYLPGQMMLRCRIDGLLRSACCCAHKGDDQGSGPVVKAQDCCDREVTQNQRPTAEAARAPNRDVAPVAASRVVATPVPLVVPPTERFDRAGAATWSSREGPPIVLLKQAFLI